MVISFKSATVEISSHGLLQGAAPVEKEYTAEYALVPKLLSTNMLCYRKTTPPPTGLSGRDYSQAGC
jgi:hypothetical protein